MNDTTELFFNENIRSVNKVVEILLLTCALVPVAFCILTLCGIWRVPHSYSALIFSYSLVCFAIAHWFNRFPKTQKIGMYFVIISTAVFVELLAVKNIISVNITYAAVPFLSCLYFNKRITITSTITAFALMVVALFLRSKTVLTVMATDVQVHTPQTWFISTLVGYSIEFLFIFLIALTMAKRSHKAIELLHSQNVNLQNTQDMIIGFVASCLGRHDLFTGRHVQHTKHYVKIIATKLRELGYYEDVLTDENIHLYETAAFLHDIGKIHVPEGVLNKIGKFTEEDYQVMKTHPVEGKRLLEQLARTFKMQEAETEKQEVEWWENYHNSMKKYDK